MKGNINKVFYPLRHFRSVFSVLIVFNFINVVAQTPASNKANLVTISGKVRDAKTKMPVITAQIKSLNYEAAATVKDDGTFQIDVASKNEILSVSAVDYGTREVSVRGSDSVIIDLYPSFFTNRYKDLQSLTGPVSNTFVTMGANGIDKIATSSNISIDNEIQTQLGGSVRSVSRSGFSGIGSSLFIQGFNSLNANAQPLFVVDGVIWENTYDLVSLHRGFFQNPLLAIDVADIESVTVLKDGISIYGSKAANGVILIKTKQAKDPVTKINVNSFWGVSALPSLIPMMNADQSRVYMSEMVSSAAFQGESNLNTNFFVNNPADPTYPVYHNSTDWSKQVYRNGFTQSYAINVRGGDERALYMFSLGYTGNNGLIKNTNMERINARFNADIVFTNRVNVKLNIAYTDINQELRNDGVDTVSPSYLAYVKSPFLSPFVYSASGVFTSELEQADDFGIANPTAIVQNSVNKGKQNRFNIGIIPYFKILPNLKLENQFGYNLYNVKESFFTSSKGSAPVEIPGTNETGNNTAEGQYFKNISIFNDLRLISSFKIANSHFVRGLFGWRYINNINTLKGGTGYSTSNDNPGLDGASNTFVRGALDPNKSVSAYANIDYSFQNRYLVSATFDMDASSKFGNDAQGGFTFMGTKWGAFPSGNIAWIVSSEKFMKSLRFIDLLKLRAGYGITGNDNIGSFKAHAQLISVGFDQGNWGLIVGNIANKKIKWETTYRKSLGLDLVLFNEKISVAGNFYSSNTKDLLTLKEYPYYTGMESYWYNSGELSNVGFDIDLRVKVLNSRLIKWEVGGSLGHYKNELVSLPGGRVISKVYGGELISEVGRPAALFYGFKTNGVYATQAEAEADNLRLINSYTGKEIFYSAGDIRFVENVPEGQAADHIINDLDKQIIGDPNPDFYGSFNSIFSFNNFTVDALFTYSYGNDVYNYQRSQLESGSGFLSQSIAMVNRWKGEGHITSQPKATFGDPMGNAVFSDRWIEDGSYLKFKTLTISYNLPLKVKRIEGLNIWLSVNNIMTLSHYLGGDPEFSSYNAVMYQGIDAGLLPSTRSYFMGVKINL